jgi:carbon-monoxide dehydrogenase medium subunit
LLLRHGVVQADYLVNIKRIPDLDAIRWDDGTLRIGPTVTHRRLETDPLVREHLPMFAEAESHVGNVRVRTQGTLGGNLCFADPHADPGTALLVYDTTVDVAGSDGARQLPLDEFLVGTYEVALAPDEVLASVSVQPLPADWTAAFLRIEQYYRPTLNVAVAARTENGLLADLRLAAGCVGPRPVRLADLESQARGLPLADAERVVRAAGAYLTEQLEPVDDLLGSAEYKIYLTTVLLGRALRQAVEGNGRGHHA